MWGCNSTLSPQDVTVEIIAFDLDADEVGRQQHKVTLSPNASTEVWKGDVPGQRVRTSDGQVPAPIVVQARLLDHEGGVLARYSNWPEPYKYLDFPDPSLQIDVRGEAVRLSASKPVKGIVLDIDGDDEIKWSDQAIDLFPGDEQIVSAKGLLEGHKITVRHLGDGSA